MHLGGWHVLHPKRPKRFINSGLSSTGFGLESNLLVAFLGTGTKVFNARARNPTPHSQRLRPSIYWRLTGTRIRRTTAFKHARDCNKGPCHCSLSSKLTRQSLLCTQYSAKRCNPKSSRKSLHSEAKNPYAVCNFGFKLCHASEDSRCPMP